jgi:hypothetical protein
MRGRWSSRAKVAAWRLAGLPITAGGGGSRPAATVIANIKNLQFLTLA